MVIGGILGAVSGFVKQLLDIDPNTTVSAVIGSLVIVGGLTTSILILTKMVKKDKCFWLFKD